MEQRTSRPDVVEASQSGASAHAEEACAPPREEARVIVNADDWSLNKETIQRILTCAAAGALSSVSAMVFMDVSEDGAQRALACGIEAGLHVNLTTMFTQPGLPLRLRERQQRVNSFLRGSRYSRLLFNPLLMNSFDYVVKAQVEEFARIYGFAPRRFDGHHHMHLCANVQMQGLLPRGSIVRTGKSVLSNEADFMRKWWGRLVERPLRARYRCPDYFFDLRPVEGGRLTRILELGRAADVEISVHPQDDYDFRFLMEGALLRFADHVAIVKGYVLRHCGPDSVGRVRGDSRNDAGNKATGA